MEKVSIDKDKCTLCGICIPVCVRRILEEGDEAVVVTNQNLCILCGHCKAVCPEDAPRLPSLDSAEFIQAPGKEGLPEADRLAVLFRSRRSTRNYRNAPVEREKLERIVQAGRFAPTGGNIQPVHFIVVHTPSEFDRIRDLTIDVLVDQTRIIEEAVRKHEETGEPLSAVHQFRRKHISRFKEMPGLLKQGVDRLFFGASALVACHVDPTVSTASEIDACLAAMQMVLMAETLGLGSCFIGAFVYAIDESPELKKTLEIPDTHRAPIAFVLGYPDVTFSRLVAREPARVTWF